MQHAFMKLVSSPVYTRTSKHLRNADKQKKLIQPLPDLSNVLTSEMARYIQSSRVCFFATKVDLSDPSGKSNQFEAIQIGQIILFFQLI